MLKYILHGLFEWTCKIIGNINFQSYFEHFLPLNFVPMVFKYVVYVEFQFFL